MVNGHHVRFIVLQYRPGRATSAWVPGKELTKRSKTSLFSISVLMIITKSICLVKPLFYTLCNMYFLHISSRRVVDWTRQQSSSRQTVKTVVMQFPVNTVAIQLSLSKVVLLSLPLRLGSCTFVQRPFSLSIWYNKSTPHSTNVASLLKVLHFVD